ncbi:MAG: GNAT family N-acetyltransferase [Coxiellaceae bacterium]|nr:GNAT family N-acetyltransferase [Coxiellaceae bacterium]
MNNYYITTTKKKILKNKSKIHGMLRTCFWSKEIPLEYIERFIQHSLCFAAYEKSSNQLVAFGRVISDFTTYAYICDVITDPNHRRKNIATMLMEQIFSHPDLQGLKTWSLRTTEGARTIYERNGFKTASRPETQMEINDLDIYIRPDFKNIHKVENKTEEVKEDNIRSKL